MKIMPHWLAAAVLSVAAVSGSLPAKAAFPDRPVHVIIGYAAGGGVDVTARILAQKLSDLWHQPVVVDNRDGADGAIAIQYVAQSKPDGYSILMTNTSLTVLPAEHLGGFDPVRQFAPVTLLGANSGVLLDNPNVLDIKSVKDLITAAKANPGKINFGTNGTGSPLFLNVAMLEHMTGARMVPIAYRGGGPTMVALLGGEIAFAFDPFADAMALSKAGKLRAIAVSTYARLPSAPDLPTVAESAELPDYDVGGGAWYGILAPAGTPKDIVARLHDGFIAVLHMPDIQARMARDGFVIDGSTPERFATFITQDLARWTPLVKEISIK